MTRTSRPREYALTVLSLGAGVQSTALLLMVLDGTIHADAAIFADTQAEPKEVYDHLAKLQALCEEKGFPLYVVTQGNLETHSLTPGNFITIPLHITNQKGGKGLASRQCTSQFKIRPVRRKIRELLDGRTAGKYVKLLMGISTDEIERMRDSDVQYLRNEYPLVDLGLSREDAVAYLSERGWGDTPRSACYFCPLKSSAEWRAMPLDEQKRAVEFDEKVRDVAVRFDRRTSIHQSGKPLREVLAAEDTEDDVNWLQVECEGMCGL